MSIQRLRELAIDALEQNPDDREYTDIVYKMITEPGSMRAKEIDLETVSLIYNDDILYPVLESLREKYNIRLYLEEVARNLVLTPMIEIREAEVLGRALNDMKPFYEKLKAGKAVVGLLTIAERGYIYFAENGENVYVIKPFQSREEMKIAPLASDIGIGPKLEEAGQRWFAEDFVDGFSLGSLDSNPHINQGKVAAGLGRVYGTLHANSILYNDRFCDHLIFTSAGPRMIDFGSARKSEDFSRDFEEWIDPYLEKKGTRKAFEESYEKACKGLLCNDS